MWSILTPSSSSSFAFGKGNSARGAPREKGERVRSELDEERGDVGTKDEGCNVVTAALDDNGNNRVQSSTSRSLPRHRAAALHSRNLPTMDPSEALSAMKPVSREDCGGAAPSPPRPVSPHPHILPSPSPPTVQPLTPPSSPGTRGIAVQFKAISNFFHL